MFLYLFHFHFYILIVYHREHILIFSWHQKRSIYSCWMFSRWLFKWIESTLGCHSPHVLLLISSDLAALPFESGGRQMGRRKKKKKGCCYILSSGQCPCWEPSRKRNVQYWSMVGWTAKGGKNCGYFSFESFHFFPFFSLFFFKSLHLATSFIMCSDCRCPWWCLGDYVWLWWSNKAAMRKDWSCLKSQKTV